tara:strand:+ start:1247 stop:1720 length:474 start_codon:yes stop_codon:yes gene_type:complete
MNDNNTNIYNNLIKLTRNKSLYINLKSNETFADRIVYLLLHFSFFIKVYKENNSKKRIQEIHDFIFRQIELSIRELGYGDVSINKNMKKYVNYFYDIIGNIDNWEKIEYSEKETILTNFINNPKDISFFINYFDKLFTFYKNNTLNFFTKDIEEFKI